MHLGNSKITGSRELGLRNSGGCDFVDQIERRVVERASVYFRIEQPTDGVTESIGAMKVRHSGALRESRQLDPPENLVALGIRNQIEGRVNRHLDGVREIDGQRLSSDDQAGFASGSLVND
jgi:hypothetical protein